MKRVKKTIVCMILVCMTFLCGCGKVPEAETDEVETEVEIPIVFLINPATNLSENGEFVEDFNQQFEGQYKIDVEWLTESTSGYREKLKRWNVLDEMPVIITDAGFDYDFYQLLVENERLVNLKPYMEESSQWKSTIKPEILEDCTEENGDIFLAPLGSEVKSYAGIIYNEELLKQVGYETFPSTWEEFWKCLDTLQSGGIPPLSLHGSGSYWVPMLFATSYMYGTQKGHEFLDENFPDSYRNTSMEEMMEVFKKLYNYTFKDAVDIDYDEAAERFCNGEAAIFANGYWMLQELPEEVKGKMRFAPFPGNILMNSPRMSAWAITTGYDEEVTEGAVKLLEYRVQQDADNTEKLLNQEGLGELDESYIGAVKEVGNVMPNYQMKWEQEIQNDFFTEHIPEFLEENYSVGELLEMMDKRVESIQKSK